MSDRARRRVLAGATVLATLIGGSGTRTGQAPRFGERVDVARIIVDARVLDDRGNPIPGLTADDFKIRIDGKLARVETAAWVGGTDTSVDVDAAPLESTPLEGAG